MAFRYVAITPNGEQIRGAIDVASEDQAERALWDADYRVVSLRRERVLPSADAVFPSLFSVKKQTLITFSRQLGTLIDSGVPVMRCLELLEDQAESKPLAQAIAGISKAIRGGSSFAEAIRSYPRVFPPMYAQMVELGERTGHIEQMLRELATYLEREDAVSRRVRSAMAYPSFLIVLSLVVIGILTTTALPSLVNMFKEFNSDLPLPTRILIGLTNFTTAYRMQLLASVALTALGMTWLFSRPVGRRLLDRVMLTVPILRAVTVNASAARFSRTLSILLRAGLPLTETMDMVVKTTDNSILRRSVEGIARRLMDGEGLAAPIAAAGWYPQLLVQMVAVGEETGTLDANLDITAEFFTREVDRKVDALAGMMTPALTLVVGGIVAFIALSLILPMYQLIGHISDAGAGAPPPR